MFSSRANQNARVGDRGTLREEGEEEVEQLVDTCNTNEAIDDTLDLLRTRRVVGGQRVGKDLNEVTIIQADGNGAPVKSANHHEQLGKRVEVEQARLGASGLSTREEVRKTSDQICHCVALFAKQPIENT